MFKIRKKADRTPLYTHSDERLTHLFASLSPPQEALKREEAFFRKTYPQLLPKCGCRYLSKVLNRQLLHHIRACLPSLRQRIKSQQVGHLGLSYIVNTSKGPATPRPGSSRCAVQFDTDSTYSCLLGYPRLRQRRGYRSSTPRWLARAISGLFCCQR